jgi:hypothetical protein
MRVTVRVDTKINGLALSKRLGEVSREAMGELAELAASRAKQTTAFEDRTGQLRASIAAEQDRRGWVVKADFPGGFIEGGTRFIKPRRRFLSEAVDSISAADVERAMRNKL